MAGTVEKWDEFNALSMPATVQDRRSRRSTALPPPLDVLDEPKSAAHKKLEQEVKEMQAKLSQQEMEITRMQENEEFMKVEFATYESSVAEMEAKLSTVISESELKDKKSEEQDELVTFLEDTIKKLEDRNKAAKLAQSPDSPPSELQVSLTTVDKISEERDALAKVTPCTPTR